MNDENIVPGRLRREIWNIEPNARVGDVMENGPTTFRPDNPLDGRAHRMRERKVGTVLITDADGHLLGLVYRADAKQRVKEVQPLEQQAA